MVGAMLLDPIQCRKAILARDARFDGRFFTGVLTTGIYCRPVCPARPPKAENCRYFPSAAAAQAAGFQALPQVSARDGAGFWRVAGRLQHRVPGGDPDRGRRA